MLVSCSEKYKIAHNGMTFLIFQLLSYFVNDTFLLLNHIKSVRHNFISSQFLYNFFTMLTNTTGWVNERALNPFKAEDSAFHDLKTSDQLVLRTIYNQVYT